MTRTGILTATFLIAFAGTASAQWVCGEKGTTAGADMTPIPTAEAETAPQTPILILPEETKETEEG